MVGEHSEGEQLALVVGARVRAARTSAGISLASLAERAGVGKGSLSEIERGVRNPTLSSLYSLAAALGTPLSSLLDERHGAEAASPGIVVRLLDVRREADATVEVFALTLDPARPHRSHGHGPGVREQVLVTGGRLRAGPVDGAVEAGVGDVLAFAADAEHVYEALGGPAHAINVIRTPR